MSEFGLKIKNIEAATLYEYNKGLRDHYDYKDAMFTNSLFKDFITENGLKIWKEESTRDMICLEFNFGTRSFEKELKHFHNIAKGARVEYKGAVKSGSKLRIQSAKNKKKKIQELYKFASDHAADYSNISANDIRKQYYEEGVTVEYISKKKNGDIIKREYIHYVMLYRSTGKAKKGTCMFIRDKLYKRAINYLRMGITLPEKNADIVGISAYSSLICS